MVTVEVPEQEQRRPLADQLRSAMYAASAYNEHVLIKCGTDQAVLLADHVYERLCEAAGVSAIEFYA
jgi:hypothetical protein